VGWFAVGFGIQVLACAAVGVRLLFLARRTREVPEIAFGLCFLLLGVVGYPVSVLARVHVLDSPGLEGKLLAVGLGAQNLACLALGVGTWRVFQPAWRWAPRILLFAALLFAASLAGQALSVGFRGGNDHGLWYGVGLATRTAGFGWAALESLRYWRLLRRRLRLGLADPVVTDRLRLWSTAALALFFGYASFGVCKLLGIDAATWPPLVATNLVIAGVAGVSITLAFFPPAAYLRWIAARA
jgi:hypothetical protein